MYEDVEPDGLLPHRVGTCRASFCRGNIRRHEFGFAHILRTFARGRKYPCACLTQRGHHRGANAFRAAGHQRALTLKLEIAAHERISSERILPPASTKLKFT